MIPPIDVVSTFSLSCGPCRRRFCWLWIAGPPGECIVLGWRRVMVRVGVNESVDRALLNDFTREVQLVWIPDKPQGEIEVDFWIPLSHPKHVPDQWSHLRGVRVVQAPWAGVDLLRHVFPPEVILC